MVYFWYQYSLPQPLYFLLEPISKVSYKRLIKSKVIDFWEEKLRSQASFLPSLKLFLTQYLSLSQPFRIWTTAGQKPYEVSKARIQLLFLSNQYPCGSRTRHWSKENPLGLCSHQGCKQLGIVETPQHLLLDCPSFHPLRERLVSLCLRLRHPISYRIVVSYLFQQPSKFLSLILDCSTIPEVIISAQTYGNDIFNDIFYEGRTWCFAIQRERLKMLGRWNINWIVMAFPDMLITTISGFRFRLYW